jgi:hypothetical protein
VNKQLAALAAVMALGLTGCTGSGDDPAEADPGASGSPSSTSSENRESEGAVDPATGDRLEQPSATMNAPDGFVHLPDLMDFQDSAAPRGNTSVVNLSEDPGWRDATLDEAATTSRRTKSFTPPRRMPDVELGGEPAYHLSGKVNSFNAFDEYGAVRGSRLVTVSFELETSIPKARREQMIASALATFAWQ